MRILVKSIYRLQGISLKWKLLIPFLLFAFSGTSILVLIGLTSQQNLIKEEEKKEILHHYRLFRERIHQSEMQSISLASMTAENPEVQKLLAERDREALHGLLAPAFIKLKRDLNIEQFHFHTPPAISFLRLHKPEKFGDDLGFHRKTVLDALVKGRPAGGLEKGASGFGIRGVAPVLHDGRITGSVGIGHSFGKAFLEDFHRSWDVDVALYDIKGPGQYSLIASAGKINEAYLDRIDFPNINANKPTILIAPDHFPDQSLLLGPVKDYSDSVVALIRLSVDRSEIQEKLTGTRNLMLTVGLAGIVISFLLTYFVIVLFIRPIKEIVEEAQDIAQGKRESRIAPRPNDEVGSLAQALNTMIEALKKRRVEIEDYAKILEKQVQERTSDLLDSEEKYRTLAENVPLIVYRVLRDGTTVFVNSRITESLGYTIEEAVSNRRFWRDKISGADLSTYNAINTLCFKKGEDCRVESRFKAKDGRLLNFITHAIPTKDAEGHVLWVDGMMMDITELKKLQERALQTEGIRTLGEISARVAHEIRNPLSTAGGFARRLNESLKDDENKKMAGIIVEEVAKLENFLKLLLSSIEPFDLVLSYVDVNDLLMTWIEKLGGFLGSRSIKVVQALESDLPKIQADGDRLSQAFENILKHAIISTPEGEILSISSIREEEHIAIIIIHRVDRLSEDDLEKFFFPHIERVTKWNIQDLPLSKIIIHRHGGIVNLTREGGNILKMRIEFPIVAVENLRE
ncbi:cache domain-containing protein [Thermodesulfobacteriota bacterium]